MAHIMNCIVDDGKFVNSIINTLETLKGAHTLHHVFITDCGTFSDDTRITCQELIDIIAPSDVLAYVKHHNIAAIILHGFSAFPGELLLQLPEGVKVLWKAWGYDIYRSPAQLKPLIPMQLYQPLTSRFRRHDVCDRVKRVNEVMYYYLFRRRKVQRMYARVDYFSGVFPEEYHLLAAQGHPFFRAEHLHYPYGGVDRSTHGMIGTCEGRDILLGNSGAMTNNHLDILAKLKAVDLGDRKVVVPLSYARYDRYVKALKRYAEENLACHVDFMEDFMPFDDYMRTLGTCSYAIYGHEPQAAIGNVGSSIYAGRKVFLSKTSVVYRHYTDLGIKVFTIQEDLNDAMLTEPLSDADKLHNRQRMDATDYNVDKRREYLLTLLEKLTS